jgi:oligosaccharide repeat unit polymerase
MAKTSQAKKYARAGWVTTLFATAIIAQLCAGTTFAFFSCVVLLISWDLTRRCFDVFDLRRVTIGTFWYLTYLAMIFFPAFFVYADQEGPYRSTFLFAVESVLITVPLGWWMANRHFHVHKGDVERYFTQPIDTPDRCPQIYRRVSCLLVVLAILTGLYIAEVPTIPLFYLLQNPGDYKQLVLLREDSFKLLDSPLKYMYALARGVGFPLLILVSFGAVLRKGDNKKWRTMFLISLTMGIFFASLSLAKAPVAYIFLVLTVFLYLFRGGLLSRRMVAAFLALILLFPIGVILAISSEDTTLAMALASTGTRLLYQPAAGVYYYFEVFPSHMPYLKGRSIGKLSWLLGDSYFDTPNYVGLYENPDAVDSVNANAAFIADLNADFGMLGVILGGVLAGFIMESIQIYLFRRRKTVVTLAVSAFLMVAFWNLNSTSLPVVLASNGALLALVFGWALEKSPRHAPIEALQQV